MKKQKFIIIFLLSIFILTSCSTEKNLKLDIQEDEITKIVGSTQILKKPLMNINIEKGRFKELVNKFNSIKVKKENLPNEIPKGWEYFFRIEKETNNKKNINISILNYKGENYILINNREYYKVIEEKQIDFLEFFK